jgi:hypothetical protein
MCRKNISLGGTLLDKPAYLCGDIKRNDHEERASSI